MAIETLDHEDRAQSRIYSQYRGFDKITRWLLINPNIANEFETSFESIHNMLDIDSNFGEVLDLIGRLLGQPRVLISDVPANDGIYRILLKARIAKNTSDLSFDSIHDLVEAVTGVRVNRIIDPEDMTFQIGFLDSVPTEIQNLINNFDIVPTPQGVRFTGFVVDTGPVLIVTIPTSLSSNCNYQSPDLGCTNIINITANVSGGDGNYVYSWSKVSGEGTISSGSDEAEVTITVASEVSGQGVFELNVQDGAGNNVTSNVCTVTFTETEVFDPIIITLPNSVNAECTYNPDEVDPDGCQATYTASPTVTGGDGTYSYLWSKFSGIGSIVGSASIANAQFRNSVGEAGASPGSSGLYRLVVTDGRGVSALRPITINFIETAQPPVIDLIGQLIDSRGFGVPPGGLSSQAIIEFLPNGQLRGIEINITNPVNDPDIANYINQWSDQTSNANLGSQYQVRAVVSPGVNPPADFSQTLIIGPTLGLWHTIVPTGGNPGVRWSVSALSLANTAIRNWASLDISIRSIANPNTVIDTARYTLQAVLNNEP